MANVLGSGPLGLTTSAGAHVIVPLNALSYDSATGKVGIADGAVPADIKTAATAWATYLFGLGQVVAAPAPSVMPAAKPAFVAEAAKAGAWGNDITITVTVDQPVATPATMAINVNVVNTYADLTLDTIVAALGDPGLIQLDSSTPPTNMPGAGPQDFTSDGTDGTAAIPVQGGGDTAFTLKAPGYSGDEATFKVDVAVPNPAGDKFTLTVTWDKTVSGTLADQATEFAFVASITKPSDAADFGVPKDGTYALKMPQPEDPSTKATITVPTA